MGCPVWHPPQSYHCMSSIPVSLPHVSAPEMILYTLSSATAVLNDSGLFRRQPHDLSHLKFATQLDPPKKGRRCVELGRTASIDKRAQPFYTGWYLKDLYSGADADRNGHTVVPSACTRKIAVMMAVHQGKFTLDQPVTIQAKYQDNRSGCFQHLQPGFTVQFRDLLVMMIIVSDNTSTGTVADMLGLDAINEFWTLK